jgi:hypothetical protein
MRDPEKDAVNDVPHTAGTLRSRAVDLRGLPQSSRRISLSDFTDHPLAYSAW